MCPTHDHRLRVVLAVVQEDLRFTCEDQKNLISSSAIILYPLSAG